jgi:hypothetical protein
LRRSRKGCGHADQQLANLPGEIERIGRLNRRQRERGNAARYSPQVCPQVGFATRSRGQQQDVGHTFLDGLDCHCARIGADDLAALQLAREARQRRVVGVSRIDGEYQGHGDDGKLISAKITT